MRLIKCLILTATTSGWLASAAHGQLVEVGPGYVRAPFVRVYTYPGGGGYVRAPFVSRYTPGFPRRYVRQPVAIEQFEELSWGELCQRIRQSCVRLESELERFPSAEFWRTSLKTREIAAITSADYDAPPTDETRRELTEILSTYDSIGVAPDFNRVASLPSFQTLRGALAEYILLPEARLRRQLSLAAARLDRELGRYKTGAGWKDYLLVSPNLPLSESRLRSRDDLPPPELADALARFDSAAQNPEFATINTLPAFKTMHVRLASYFSERQVPSTAPAEELPPPGPIRP